MLDGFDKNQKSIIPLSEQIERPRKYLILHIQEPVDHVVDVVPKKEAVAHYLLSTP